MPIRPNKDARVRKRSESGASPSGTRLTELQFRSLVENALDISVILGLEGIISYVSPAVVRTLGYSAEELIGQNVFGFIMPSDRQEVIEALTRVASDSQAATAGNLHSFRFKHKDGSWRYLEAISSRLPGGSDALEIVVNARDVTERVVAQEALRINADHAKHIGQENQGMAEVGRIISSTSDIAEVYESFAQEAKKLIEFDRVTILVADLATDTLEIVFATGLESQMAGPTAGQRLPFSGNLTESAMEKRAGIILQGEEFATTSAGMPSLEYSSEAGARSYLVVPLISKDQPIGALVFRSLNEVAYYSMDVDIAQRIANQIAGAIMIYQDAAERMLAEEALRESESRYRDLMDIMTDGFWRARPSGELIFVSEQIANFLGYDSPQEFIASISDLGPQLYVDPERRIEMAEALRLSGSVKDFEVALHHKRGGIVWFSTNAKAIYGQDGQVEFFEGTQTDITERKRAEEALQKSEEDAQHTAIEQAAFAEIGRTIGSSLEIESVYESFAEEAHRLIKFNQVTISLVGPDETTARVAFNRSFGGAPLGRKLGVTVLLPGSITEATIRNRKCVVVGNEEDAKPFNLAPQVETGVRSFLSTPLVFQDRGIGALLFLSSDSDAYDEKDTRLAEGIGNQIAGAIGNSQMYADLQMAEEAQRKSEDALRDELERAARIQVELLPSKSPNVPHFGLAARCIPANQDQTPVSNDDIPETGRGLQVARALLDTLNYRRTLESKKSLVTGKDAARPL